jgi:hypothetical protein
MQQLLYKDKIVTSDWLKFEIFHEYGESIITNRMQTTKIIYLWSTNTNLHQLFNLNSNITKILLIVNSIKPFKNLQLFIKLFVPRRKKDQS